VRLQLLPAIMVTMTAAAAAEPKAPAAGGIVVAMPTTRYYKESPIRLRLKAPRDASGIRDAVLQVYDRKGGLWHGHAFMAVEPDPERPGQALAFFYEFRPPAPGVYLMRVLTRDRAGNVTPGKPTDGPERAVFRVVYDPDAPKLALEAPGAGRALTPGAPVRFAWRIEESNLRRAEIAGSPDGKTWTRVRSVRQPKGEASWRVPAAWPGGRIHLRLSAEDFAGNRAEVLLGDASISSLPGLGELPDEKVTLPGFARGDRKAAIEAYRKGLVYLHRGVTGEAIPLLEEAVRLDPSLLPARVDLSVAYSGAGRLAQAETLLRETLEIHPKKPELLYNLARVEYLDERPEEAASTARCLLETAPRHVEGLFLLALVRAREGRVPEARTLWKRLVAVAPADDPAAQPWVARAKAYLAASELGVPEKE